jgi:hypothetical protein
MATYFDNSGLFGASFGDVADLGRTVGLDLQDLAQAEAVGDDPLPFLDIAVSDTSDLLASGDFEGLFAPLLPPDPTLDDVANAFATISPDTLEAYGSAIEDYFTPSSEPAFPANVPDTVPGPPTSIESYLSSLTPTDGGLLVVPLTPAQLLSGKDVLHFLQKTFSVNVGDYTIRGRSASMLAAHLGASAPNLQTVQFADGQLSFDPAGAAAQVTRLYQAALNRAPDQPGLHNAIGALDYGGSLQDLANSFIGSAEFQTRFGANLSNSAFVTQLYANVLQRGPDSDGLANWTHQLDTGASRASILVGFSESAENITDTAMTVQSGIWNVDQNGPQVARLYDTVFGRLPDVGGLQNWQNTLDSAAMSLSAVAGAFTTSPEFQAKYGGLSNTAFVTNLYLNALHRNPDQAGLNNWVDVLNSGGAGRSDVVLGFSESQEHQANTASNIISNDPASYGIKTA